MAPSADLSRVPFFASLEADALREVAAACRPRRFERGELLFQEGDLAETLYVLESGHVKLVLVDASGEETILHVAGPGEALGELSLVDGEPRSTTAVALNDVEVLTLYRREFLELLHRRPCVEWAVMRQLAQMVRRADAQLQDVTSLDVGKRLAKKLLELAEQHGEATPDGIRIPVPLTQHDLARLLGLNRASVYRYLHRFAAEGVLSAGRDGIVLHKPEALRKRLGWDRAD